MAEYYLSEFQGYLKTLCVHHKDVLHDDVTNKAFFRFQSDEELQAIPNIAGRVAVGVGDYTGRSVGDFEEAKVQQVPTIVFLVYASNTNGDLYAAIENAQKKAQEVMFQFYARMKHDLLMDDCGPLRYLQAEQMSFSPIGPVLEMHYGWEMDLPFKSTAPAYDPNKWNDA